MTKHEVLYSFVEFELGPNKIPCQIWYDYIPDDKTVGYLGGFFPNKVYFNNKEFKKKISKRLIDIFFEELDKERREYLDYDIC